jgi:predicted kinase
LAETVTVEQDGAVSQRSLFVVVSGLAATGKTRLAEPLAHALDLPLISKDAIKESLFDAVGYGGWEWSKTLSRAADSAMVRIAQDLDGAVLDNFWYAETVDELLAPLPRSIVEVFCRCEPDVAHERFRRRVRHPGHADHLAATSSRKRRSRLAPRGYLCGSSVRSLRWTPNNVSTLAWW